MKRNTTMVCKDGGKSRMNPTSILPSTIVAKIGGNFWDFGGTILLQFKVGLGLVGLGKDWGSFFGISWSSYLHSYLESYPNPTLKCC